MGPFFLAGCLLTGYIVALELLAALLFHVFSERLGGSHGEAVLGQDVVGPPLDDEVPAQLRVVQAVNLLELASGIVLLPFQMHLHAAVVDPERRFAVLVIPAVFGERAVRAVPAPGEGDDQQHGADEQIADAGQLQAVAVERKAKVHRAHRSQRAEDDAQGGGDLLLLEIHGLKILEDGVGVGEGGFEGAEVDENWLDDQNIDRRGIEWIDVAVNPYNWSVNGNEGCSAYLSEITIKLQEGAFEQKYSSIPEEAPF